MARTKQLAKNSTGGKAPRKAPRKRLQQTKQKLSKKEKIYNPPEQTSDTNTRNMRRTLINPFTDQVIVYVPEKSKPKKSPLSYVMEEFGDEVARYDEGFQDMFRGNTGIVQDGDSVGVKTKTGVGMGVAVHVPKRKAPMNPKRKAPMNPKRKAPMKKSFDQGFNWGGSQPSGPVSLNPRKQFTKNASGGWSTPASNAPLLGQPNFQNSNAMNSSSNSSQFTWEWLLWFCF
eukprot:TRINITY_DN223_c0_g1_i5.p1 TRINITY_DN223_c0_g1~~TRINITY_DN223_c0_g1_i5.p1  ORF type:complete len:230 (-),score=40.64 TRINITY_DN223_c0_g1_i5:383-1072(-)